MATRALSNAVTEEAKRLSRALQPTASEAIALDAVDLLLSCVNTGIERAPAIGCAGPCNPTAKKNGSHR
jgi:hypothetical protein